MVKSCDTCTGECCGDYDGLKTCLNNNYLGYFKQGEKKEKQMKYVPTDKCTLKNIADKIHETGCRDAKVEFFDVIYETRIKDGYSPVPKMLIEVGEIIFENITKTEKRRNWLLEHGFIKEDIELQNCLYCGGEIGIGKNENTTYYWECPGCGIKNSGFLSKKDAYESVNRKG